MTKAKQDETAPDRYLKLIDRHWPQIMTLYERLRALNPIIEFEWPKKRLYAYPAIEYINTLSDKTREATKKHYKRATAQGKIMIFVKDTKNRVLRSYIFELESRRTALG